MRVVGETGVYESGAGGWRALRSAAAGRRSSRRASARRAAAQALALRHDAIERAPRVRGGLTSPRTAAATWRAANGDLLGGDEARFGERRAVGYAAAARDPSLGPVAASAGHGLVAYVGLRGLRRAPAGPKFNGIAKTTDGGRTLDGRPRGGGPARPPNLEGSWIEERALEDGHSRLVRRALRPRRGARRSRRLLRDRPLPHLPDAATAAGPGRQVQLGAARGDDRWVSRGLDVTNAYGVHWDPFDARASSSRYTDIGLFRSEDGGATLDELDAGRPHALAQHDVLGGLRSRGARARCGAPSAAPTTCRGRRCGGAPIPTVSRAASASPPTAARTWTPCERGHAGDRDHARAPRSRRARRQAARSTRRAFGRGVFKSDGRRPHVGGEERGPRAAAALRLAHHARAGRRALPGGGAAQRARARSATRDDGALYRSTDGAEHWTRLTLPAGTNGPNGLAVDPAGPAPAVPRGLGRAPRPAATPAAASSSSTDAGATWRTCSPRVPARLRRHRRPARPRRPLRVAASTRRRSARRDRGATWTRLRGFNFKWGHRVVPDPRDPAQGLRHDVRRQRVARPGRRAIPRAVEDVVPAGRSAPAARPTRVLAEARAARRGERRRHPRVPDPAGAQGGQGRSRVLAAERALRTRRSTALVAHQDALLATDPAAVRAWAAGPAVVLRSREGPRAAARGRRSALPDRLPVNVFTDVPRRSRRRRRDPRDHARHRQPLPDRPRGRARRRPPAGALPLLHRASACRSTSGSSACPAATPTSSPSAGSSKARAARRRWGSSAAEWQIAGRKIWNWGEKNLHIARRRVSWRTSCWPSPTWRRSCRGCEPLPAQQVAVIGHSFTMDLHWASPSAFVPIVTAMFARENPQVEFRQFQGGGLTVHAGATTVSTRTLSPGSRTSSCSWSLNRTDADLAALQRDGATASRRRAPRVYAFDDVHDPGRRRSRAAPAKEHEVAARAAGIDRRRGGAAAARRAPDRDRFLCLDGIHMTEPYHRLMAKEWLKLLAGARGVRLAAAGNGATGGLP